MPSRNASARPGYRPTREQGSKARDEGGTLRGTLHEHNCTDIQRNVATSHQSERAQMEQYVFIKFQERKHSIQSPKKENAAEDPASDRAGKALDGEYYERVFGGDESDSDMDMGNDDMQVTHTLALSISLSLSLPPSFSHSPTHTYPVFEWMGGSGRYVTRCGDVCQSQTVTLACVMLGPQRVLYRRQILSSVPYV